MKLYLEKRGCDFWPDEENARRESDLENHRLFLEFIAKDGRRICGDISRGDIRQPFTNKRGKVDYKTVSLNGLYAHFQYENHTGCYAYEIRPDFTPHFTKADALRLINAVSAVQYDEVVLVQCLPDAAHDYPEYALAMEREYLERDHAALVAETEEHIRDNFMAWVNRLRWAFSRMTPEEYKRLSLLAFKMMAEQYGVIEEEPENKLAPAALAAHHLTKHFFEEQLFVDPYADVAFLKEIEAYSPYYVGRYLLTYTPEEFAAKFGQ